MSKRPRRKPREAEDDAVEAFPPVTVKDMLEKQAVAAGSNSRTLDLTGIDPEFWRDVDPSSVTPPIVPWVAAISASVRVQEVTNIAITDARPLHPLAPGTLASPGSTPATRTSAASPPSAGETADDYPPAEESAYSRHLRGMLAAVLGDPASAALLTRAEAQLAAEFLRLDAPSAALLARLFARKGPWFRVASLRYAEMAGGQGWWARESAEGKEAAASAPPAPSRVDPRVHAATMAVAVRALSSAGFLVTLPGCSASTSASGSGVKVVHAAANTPRNPFQSGSSSGGSRNKESRVGGSDPVPADILLSLEAVHCCFSVPEVKSLLAQLGGSAAASGKAGGSSTVAALAASAAAPVATPSHPSSAPPPPLLSGAKHSVPPPTRPEMLAELAHRVFSQRTVFGGFLPLSKCVAAVSTASEQARGAPFAGGPLQPSARTSPSFSNRQAGSSAATPRHGRGGGGAFSSPAASKAKFFAFSVTPRGGQPSSSANSTSPLVRVSRDAYAMLRRAHSLYYIATATANLSSGQGTGAWAIAGGVQALHAGLEPWGSRGDASPLLPFLRSSDFATTARIFSEWRRRLHAKPAAGVDLAFAAPSSEASDAAAVAAAAGRARGASKWNSSASGSRYADTAAATDSYIPAGSGAGSGAVGMGSGGVVPAATYGGGRGSIGGSYRLYRLSSGESWSNSGLYSPGLLQTFRKLDFAAYSCAGSAGWAARVFPTLAHFRALEAAHVFRAQVDCVGVFGMLLSAPQLTLSDPTGATEHLGFVRRPGPSEPPAQASPKALIAAESLGSAPPLLAGLQLLPYAALLVGVPLDVWADALGLSHSPPQPQLAHTTTAPSTRAAPAAGPTLRCGIDPSTGTEVVELLSSSDEEEGCGGNSVAASPPKPAQSAASDAITKPTPAALDAYTRQCAQSVWLAVAALPGVLAAAGVAAAEAVDVPVQDDLCGPAPPAESVGVASLRVFLRICGPSAIAAAAAAAAATNDSVDPADGSAITAQRRILTPAQSALSCCPGNYRIGKALLGAQAALLVAYRVSLAAAITQLWHVSSDGPTSLPAHPWLHQLTAPSLMTSLLWEAIDPLERSRWYSHTLPFLSQLVLSCGRFTPHRSGRWWARLSLNLSHVGLHADAAAAGRAGLAVPSVRAGERLALLLRTVRLEKKLAAARAAATVGSAKRRGSKRAPARNPTLCQASGAARSASKTAAVLVDSSDSDSAGSDRVPSSSVSESSSDASEVAATDRKRRSPRKQRHNSTFEQQQSQQQHVARQLLVSAEAAHAADFGDIDEGDDAGVMALLAAEASSTTAATVAASNTTGSDAAPEAGTPCGGSVATDFTPEDPDVPRLVTLRRVCDAARLLRGEATLPLAVNLRIDGFVRRALNSAAGQKSVFISDYDEDNDGAWDSAAAGAVVSGDFVADTATGAPQSDKTPADAAAAAASDARSRIRLLADPALPQLPSSGAHDAQGSVAVPGQPDASLDDFFNATLEVCAAFGWEYPHGPAHPKYDPHAANPVERIEATRTESNAGASFAGEATADVGAAATAATPVHAPAVARRDAGSLVRAVTDKGAEEEYDGEGRGEEEDAGYDLEGEEEADVGGADAAGGGDSAATLAVASAPAVAAAPAPLSTSTPFHAPASAPPRRTVRFGKGGVRYFAAAESHDSSALLSRATVGAAHLRVGVEGLSLCHYALGRQGGWAGCHCEGGALLTVHALLLWPVIFSPGVPGALLTPFQDGPLDWDSPGTFYRNRLALLSARLAWIAGASGPELTAELGTVWRANYGKACRGVRWDAWPLQLLQLIAVGIGGGPLACLCDALAWNHKQLGGGMPDLLLWRVLLRPPTVLSVAGPAAALDVSPAAAAVAPTSVDVSVAAAVDGHQLADLSQTAPATPTPDMRSRDAKEAAHWPDLALPAGAVVHVRFAEVKGPRDRLSEKQHVWLRILLAAGCDAAVCKVTEPLPVQSFVAAKGSGSQRRTAPAPRHR